MEQRFITIDQITSQPPGQSNPDFIYGSRPILYRGPEHSPKEQKPLNKLRSATERLQSAGVFSPDAQVKQKGLLHGVEGGMVFISLQHEGREHYTAARVAQYDGDKFYSNSDFKPDLLSKPAPELVTGVCLFGAYTALGLKEDGTKVSLTDPLVIRDTEDNNDPIVKLEIDKRLHPYEADTIYRVTSFMDALGVDPTSVNLHIPRVEYYLYGLEFQRRGLMSDEALREWIGQVDTRAEGVGGLMKRRAERKHTVNVVAPLAGVETYIKDTAKPDLEEIKGILAEDELWAKIFSRENPQTFTDLNYLSYIQAYLNVAGRAPVIAIENPEEQAILINAKNMLDIHDKPASMVGLYPHPRLIMPEGDKRMMYYYPNHDGRTSKALADVARANQR